MDSLIYIGIVIAIMAIAGFGLFGIRKYNVNTKEKKLAELSASIVKYILSQFDYPKGDLVDDILMYLIKAIKLIDTYENLSIEQRNELIKIEALKICELEGIKVDDELVNLIDLLLEYINANQLVEEIINSKL